MKINKKYYYLKIRNISAVTVAIMILLISIINLFICIFFIDIIVIFIRWSIVLSIFLLAILALILGRVKILIDIEIKSYPEYYCQICNDWLDKHSNYPKNFPDKYRICCNCNGIAEYIYMKDSVIEWDWADKFYRKRKKKFDELFVIKESV